MDGGITKEEYNDLRGKIDAEIRELNEKIESIQSGGVLKKQQEELLSDITNAVQELADGVVSGPAKRRFGNMHKCL